MKKTIVKLMLLAAVTIPLLVGCAKPPVQELEAAKASIEASVAAGAPVYGPQELASVRDELAAAEKEIKVQDEKWFKNFDNAKAMLAKTKGNAEKLTADIPARKEAAKQKAIAAEGEANTAIAEAKTALAAAPKGKGTRADIEAFQGDLKGIEDSMAEIKPLMDKEDFFGAADKAASIRDRAKGITTEINAAIEKIKAAKGGKKK